jgi:hypothetical protein
MLLLAKINIFSYFFYCYNGYNSVHRILQNKPIDYAILNYRGYSFIGKRLFMLSHLVFLYNAYFIEYPDQNTYFNVIILQITVNGGYYIKWGTQELSTFLLHVYHGILIIVQGSHRVIFNNFNLNYENYYVFMFLLFYSRIYHYIYTPRIYKIDNLE